MKLFVFAISVFIVAAQPRINDSDWKECMDELGVTKDVIESTKWDDSISRCVIACWFKKNGIVKDAKVVYDVIFDLAKEDIQGSLKDKDIKELLNVCIEKAHQETNECDVSYVFLRCMNDSPPAKN